MNAEFAKVESHPAVVEGDRAYVVDIYRHGDLYPWTLARFRWKPSSSFGELLQSGQGESLEDARQQAVQARDVAMRRDRGGGPVPMKPGWPTPTP